MRLPFTQIQALKYFAIAIVVTFLSTYVFARFESERKINRELKVQRDILQDKLSKCTSNNITYEKKVKNKKGTQEIENKQVLDNSISLLSLFQPQKVDTVSIIKWYEGLTRKEKKEYLR